jgi:hypothetical protein
MNAPHRREFIKQTFAATAGGWVLSHELAAAESATSGLHLARFKFDVSPPKGHSCCGGWIKPVEVVDDPLEAIGLVLLGAGKPIVICAVDWTGLLNEAHLQWRQALAEAVGTTPERVAVHCVHQHNAPFACLEAERIVLEQGDLPHIVEVDFFRRCLERARTAAEQAVSRAEPLTHIAHGQARVEQVAANRRVSRDAQGRVQAMRGSSCRDPVLCAMPEGLIDPWLKTVAFFHGEKKLAACHYYATHPMSYYADGRVSSDFVGLARKRRQQEEPDCTHLYFTGCAGNVAAGKYNDGSHERRPILRDRVYDALVASEADLATSRKPLETIAWKTIDVLPPPRATLRADELAAQIANKQNPVVGRNRPSYMLSWLRRVESGTPMVLSALRLGGVSMLHLPSECFVEYQLRAQRLQPDGFVATAAYGDGGPWYIPTREEYPNGGYEVSVAFCEPEVDEILTKGMTALLSG